MKPIPIFFLSEISSFTEFLDSGLKYLEFGLLGVGLFLAILCFVLIIWIGNKKTPSPNLLEQVKGFRKFALSMTALGIVSVIVQTVLPKPSVDLEYEVKGLRKSVDPNFDKAYQKFQQSQVIPEATKNITFYKDDELWSYIDERKDSIKELLISGAHLLNGVGRIKQSLKYILERGGVIKVLITSPRDTATIKLQALRKSPPHLFEQVKSNIDGALQELATLSPSENLIIRTASFPLEERLHIINPELKNGRLYAKIYPYMENRGVEFGGIYFYFDKEGEKDKLLYDYYYTKFKNLFNTGIDLKLSKPK